jgi:TolB-like protein
MPTVVVAATRCRRPACARGRAAWRRASAVLVLLAVCAARHLEGQCPDGTPPPCAAQRRPAPAPNSVAVLYFDNLSSDTADVFLANGLTEELIARLSQVRRLEVKSRFESQRVRGRRPADPRAIGRTVGASYLVTGSLRQVGRRVRVIVALVRAQSGRQVWGEVYERTGDLFAIQADVAREVAGAITGRLLPDERASLARRPTRDPVAYNLFVRGVGAANTLSESGLRAGLDYLDRAIARDTAFAEAYVQKAVAWYLLADGYVEGRVGYARVREAAGQALRLDSTLATAYAMLAEAGVALDADVAGAQRLALRAVTLDPKCWWAHLALMKALLLSGGRDDSAVAEARRAWEADTLSGVNAWAYLWTLSALQRADSIAALLPRMENALEREDLRAFDGVARLARGEPAEVERLSWSYYGGVFAAERVRALLALGRRDGTRHAVDSIAEASRHHYYNAFGVARAYAALGEADSAFAWLDRAWEQRTIWLVGLRAYGEFTPLHADPRWAALLRRMGLER